ncbi:hypothetical protein [Nocardioides donggukensis]|uniref:Uncharacterized protein n=1 Tax=Nocardioides donggukensis TaxID=2774019 RepID=A0A927K187_9ACTN|nr:hypothetical protein [Nocardioides donggukensis]MBD8868059.1 hypothetical protein [Nocardioides donggukensis]
MFSRKRTTTTDDTVGTHADPEARAATDREMAKDKYGGVNLGAAFFGWLVAIGMTILLTGIIGALAAAVSSEANVTLSDADLDSGTIGLVAGIVLLVVLALAYYAGGYVAGRMSRFDGARQGVAVWLLGLVITVVAAVLGAVAGDQYNVLDRVDLPNIPLPRQDVTTAGIITGVIVLVVTALAAAAGGKVGRNYHRKVDAAHYG